MIAPKRILRDAAGALADIPGLFGWAAGRVTIFNYHEVSDRPSLFNLEHRLNVPPLLFARQLDWITTHFEPVTAQQLLEGRLPARAALITFDDGFASTFETALPILHSRHVPSLVFVNGAAIQGEILWAGLVAWLHPKSEVLQSLVAARQHGRSLPPQLLLAPAEVTAEVDRMGRAEVLEAAAEYTGRMATPAQLTASVAHGATIGNHLDNHYNASTLEPGELRDAYARNEEILGTYPHYMPLFSYPFGQPVVCYNRGTHRTLREAGARRLFGAWALPNPAPGACLLHRCTLGDDVRSAAAFRFEAIIRPWINLASTRAPRRSALRDAIDAGMATV